MLGNFSIGDYFKQGAARVRAGSSRSRASASSPTDIWVTVFEGDDELGLGPDEEAIAVWEAIGVPRSRIVAARPRGELLAGRARPARAGRAASCTSTAAWSGAPTDDLPGGDNERFLEYWNLVFMQYDQDPVGTLTPLPAKNIDTGLGLNRMALIQQGVDSIFETDQFLPLMTLGRELATTRARRPRAADPGRPHARR